MHNLQNMNTTHAEITAFQAQFCFSCCFYLVIYQRFAVALVKPDAGQQFRDEQSPSTTALLFMRSYLSVWKA